MPETITYKLIAPTIGTDSEWLSKDDTFIPKEYLEDLAKRKDNIEIETINSKLHNPLTSLDHKNKTIKLIKDFQR